MAKSMRKKLLIITASYWQLPVIETARRLGLELVATDRDPGAPGLKQVDHPEIADSEDQEAILAVARKHRVDGIISEQTDAGVVSAAYAAERLGLAGVGYETALNATNKWRMRECCRKAGLPVPRYHRVQNVGDAVAAAEAIGFPVVIKPVDCQASRGVFKVASASELRGQFDKTKCRSRQDYYLVEEMMTGTESSAESFVAQGRVQVYGVCRKIKCPPPHTFDMQLVYPSAYAPDVERELRDMNERVIQAVGIPLGITHAEYIVTPQGVRLLEIAARGCGARVTTDLVPAMTGVNLIEARIRQALGESIGTPQPTRCKAGILQFYVLPAGRVCTVAGLEAAKKIPGVVALEYFVREGSVIDRVESGDQRHGFLLAVSDQRDQLAEICNQVQSVVQIQVDQRQAA